MSLTTVLNSGFLDEVSMELESTLFPDVDPKLILIGPLPAHPQVLTLPTTTVAGPGGRPIWPPALASGASEPPSHCC